MPIEDLRNRPAKFPRAGKIKLGVMEVKGDKTYPRDVAWFVIPEELKKAYGEKPKRLNIRFPYDDPEQVLDAWFQRWQGPLLTLKCDGTTFREFAKDGKSREGACRRLPVDGKCEPVSEGKDCACGAVATGTLLVMVLEGQLGVYQLVMRGLWRLGALLDQLRMYRGVFGRLVGIPFHLERIEVQQGYTKADGSRGTRTAHPVRIQCDVSNVEALRAAGWLDALPTALPSAEGVTVPPEEAPEPPEDAEDATITPAPRGTEPPPLFPETGTKGQDLGFTLEGCAKEAVQMGISPTLFRRYVQTTYGATPTQQQLADLWASLDAAKRSPETKTILLKTMAVLVNKTLGVPTEA